jgi:hypothetical protein
LDGKGKGNNDLDDDFDEDDVQSLKRAVCCEHDASSAYYRDGVDSECQCEGESIR